MGYPCQVFHAAELSARVQADLSGRRRKFDAGVRGVDLAACELQAMLQYKCEIKDPSQADSPVRCYAVERLFRKCKDRKGPFLVETTAWEGKNFEDLGKKDGSDETAKKQKHFQWSSSWHDADTAP